MRWEKVLLIVSGIVFLLAVIYSAVIFYQLRLQSEPKASDNPLPEQMTRPPRAKREANSLPSSTATPNSISSPNPIPSETEGDTVHQQPVSQLSSDDSVSHLAEDEEDLVTDAVSPYPTVPPGYPLKPFWELPLEVQANTPPEQREAHLVLHKVLIELWKRGDQNFVSGIYPQSLGKVYPLYPNTIYVRWGASGDDGIGAKKRYVSRAFGPGALKLPPLASEEDIPLGVRVIDLDSEEGKGIDPHQFLLQ